MGNRSGRGKDDDYDCSRGLQRQGEKDWPAQQSHEKNKSSVVNWEDESSVVHQSAINCLHNYALGKMGQAQQEDASKCVDQMKAIDISRRSFKALTFSDNLEETFSFVEFATFDEDTSSKTASSRQAPVDCQEIPNKSNCM